MTAAESRDGILFAMDARDEVLLSGDRGDRLAGATRAVMGKVDSFAAAVRAETLAPATREKSDHIAEVESEFRAATTMKVCIWREHRDVIADELDRLRAALAAAETENAELRKLCEMAGGLAKLTSSEDNCAFAEVLYAAARRAGK